MTKTKLNSLSQENTKRLTSVNISSSGEPTALHAAEELLKYLQKKGISADEKGFSISITVDPSFAQDSYKIEASLKENEGMTVCGDKNGVLYGVYNFLEEYAGVRFFTPTLELCPTGDVIIPEGLVLEHTPAIKARRLTWDSVRSHAEWCAKNGINNCDVILPVELGGSRLNYGKLFVHTVNILAETTYPYPAYGTNPCLTDPEVLATVIKNVRKELDSNPAVNIVSVSQNDFDGHCQCPNCSKIEEEDGTPAGPLLRFVNKVAENLAPDYPHVTVDTLAYKYTQTPPRITKPRENVCIRLCSINCCFTHPLSAESCTKNKKFYDDLVGWGKICDKIHIWDYTTNFHYYISTFANFGVIQKNMRFFAENNVVSMFPQGNSQGASGEFGELRAYLLAKLMWDPYMSEETYSAHMDEFLKAYYGEGWEYVRKFIDKTTELAANGGFAINKDETEGDPICGQGIYGHPFTAITRQEYLDHEALFDECWKKAEELAGDRLEFVKRSKMQWRLTKLYLYPNAEAAQSLIDDAKAAGVVWKEGLFNVQEDSDLTLSPYFWKYGK